MTEVKHTPGPWGWEYYDRDVNRPVALSAGGVDVLLATGTGGTAWAEVKESDRQLIAASPEMLAELTATERWLNERAAVLRQLADQAPGVMRKRNEHLRQLRDEAARLEGRAAVIRQTILKATQGA